MLLQTIIAILFVLLIAATIGIMQLARRTALLRHDLAGFRSMTEAANRRGDISDAVLNAVFAASTDAVLIVDANGLCLQLNAQAKSLFHTSAPGALFAVTRSSEIVTLFQASRQESHDRPFTSEIILHLPEEKMVHAAIVGLPATLDPEQPPRTVIVLKDITDLRRLETVRRDFVANVSHELRTPLSSVKAMAETLLDGALEDPTVGRHFLETIVREADRLVRLAADLLDLSRVETQPVSKSACDVAALLHDVAMRLSSQKNKSELSLTVQAQSPMIAFCDPDEIAQVVVNLIDNAIKYTPPGGTITINARREESRIVVEVADTGIGILQQDLPRLFERFYRSDKARSRQSGGTGLGLSIVKHIIERHDGEIWVRSEYNRGSTFGFALPSDPALHEPALAVRSEALLPQ